MNTPMEQALDSRDQANSPSRSLPLAYLLLVIGGYYGAHRFFVGRWLTGICYPVVFLVTILIFPEVAPLLILALLVIDAILLPRLVRIRNAQLAEEFAANPERFLVASSEDIAPWARGNLKKGFLATWVRAPTATFLILPLLTGVAAAELRSFELLMIPFVILLAVGLIGSLDQILQRFPALQEIPGVGPGIERVEELRLHFWHSEPKVRSSLWGLFRHGLTSHRPYWRVAIIVAATVCIEAALSWEDSTSYITPIETLKIVAITAGVAAGIVLANLVPLTTLSFRYSLSGQRGVLRFLTAGALAAMLLGYLAIRSQVQPDGQNATFPSTLSEMRLTQRMKDSEFREELAIKMDMFLRYYIGEDVDSGTINRDFQNILVGLAPNDEANAFRIVEQEDWGAVLYNSFDSDCIEGLADAVLLAAVDKSEQVIHYSWESVSSDSVLNRYIKEECRELIDDMY